MNFICRFLQNISRVSSTALIVLAILLSCHHVDATTVSWTGSAGDSLWSTASNWDSSIVPIAGDDVTVTGGEQVTIEGIAVCRSIVVGHSTSLRVNGQLTMTGSSNHAISIFSSAFLYNYGQIIISDVSDTGIKVFGTLTNMASGMININNVTGNSSNGILNTKTFTNYGTIHIMDCEGIGFRNNHEFQNHGVLNISRIANSIFNDGEFNNETNGRIIIDDSVVFAIQNIDQMTNRGMMKILDNASRGLFNEGKFENYDSLIMSNKVTYGVQNRDTLINYNSGVIIIDSSAWGIYNDNFIIPDVYLSNHGVISISNGSRGLLISGKVENHGHFDIRNMTIRGINTADTLRNYPGAIVSIDMVTHPFREGILNGLNSLLQNEGQINVSNISGVGIKNLGTFIQLPTGNCTTTNITLDPFISDVASISDILGVLTFYN